MDLRVEGVMGACQTTTYSSSPSEETSPIRTSRDRAQVISAHLATLIDLITASLPRLEISCVPLIKASPSLGPSCRGSSPCLGAIE